MTLLLEGQLIGQVHAAKLGPKSGKQGHDAVRTAQKHCAVWAPLK